MEETGVARFEGRVGGDVVCCWGVAVGGWRERVVGGRRVVFFEHGVHLYMHLLVMRLKNEA